MGYPVSQGVVTTPLDFLMVQSSDHITGATGVSPTVTILKAGTSAFVSPGGAVTEIGSGWYRLTPTSSDVSALGPLLLHATAATCDPRDDTFTVVNYNPSAITPVSAPASIGAITGLTLISDAFIEAEILAAGETLSAEDSAFGLGKVNRLIDNWNATREQVYDEQFLTFTLTPSLSPHTIGPTGTWVTSQRPVSIDDVTLLLNSGSQLIRTPITLRDATWYANLTTPEIETSIPTDLYYSTDWTNGSLYFWPVPSTAYDVELTVRIVLSQLTLTGFVSLPPGYRDAITLTLAEDLCASYGRGRLISPLLRERAREARARIIRNNTAPVRIATRDAGMPGGRGGETFNYLSGLFGTGRR